MTYKTYNPGEIEPKWQKVWEKKGQNVVDIKNAKKPFYNLMMFPYPSAEGLHVGNMYAFTASDIYGRFKRHQGLDVFEPIGLDGFGIHSENYALKIGRHPKEHAFLTEKNFYAQLHKIGCMFDWTKTVETYHPDYYKWTQWVFVQMFKAGLAYRGKALVNWCPTCKTVLSDEQVIDGKCERTGDVVIKKETEQWFFKITAYADRLLDNLAKIDWTEKIKTAQRNWIGRKEGINITYKIKGSKETVMCFTTAPVNFGASFIVLAPEHELAKEVAAKNKEVAKYVEMAAKETDEDRIAKGRDKTGVFTGLYAINHVTGKEIPIWVTDFVLATVGTGAVQGCPGHDLRDFEFAKKFGIPIPRVIVGADGDESSIERPEQVVEHGQAGHFVNSDFLNGLEFEEGLQKTMDYFEKQGWGKKVAIYHLRDWLVSRQRYWGAPIPMINCPKCGWQAVPEEDLPVLLPDIADYQPEGNGKGPLAKHKEFYGTTCPKCGGKARRETDVCDTFLDSAWYFLRYPSVGDDQEPFAKVLTKKWLPVEMYTGGAEHAVLHLMYSRFVAMVLKDKGFIEFEEPFTRFFAHGLLIKDGAKMSKSKGNVVNPDEYIAKFGADAIRLYMMFMGPVDQGGDFRDSGMSGMRRWVEKVAKLTTGKGEARVDQSLAKLIKKSQENLEARKYNLVIAGMMAFLNESMTMNKEQMSKFLVIFSVFAPHLAEEMWEQIGNKGSVHTVPWPEAGKIASDEVVTLVVTVNGKPRGTLSFSSKELQALGEKGVIQKAQNDERVKKYLTGQVKRSIYVPEKIVNFVV
ncbi:leucine--tRNA ligase [Candidatus Microgenomates bacterium]|nr:leucine--tRNA ligase [Candidatus Microgenomates bacterium]